jgi:hypothetical protein
LVAVKAVLIAVRAVLAAGHLPQSELQRMKLIVTDHLYRICHLMTQQQYFGKKFDVY